MRAIQHPILSILFLSLSVLPLFGQKPATISGAAEKAIWQNLPKSALMLPQAPHRQIANYRPISANLDVLQNVLNAAPLRFSEAAKGKLPLLSIPLPDGKMADFYLLEAPVMEPELAAQFPEIRSFAGWSEADPTAYLRCGITQKGFHAVLFSAQHSTIYIDAEGDNTHYISYYKKDFLHNEPFACNIANDEETIKSPNHQTVKSLVGDCKLRTYALALACTGEYAQFHGGTVASVMAEFNVAMTRINGIYEREAGVHLTMVNNTNLLIFLNAATDPYTNNDGGTMLDENIATCASVIGNANFDIGHVFSTGGGGVAYLNAVCNNGIKAGGVTGLGSPVGDAFYVDYVAHEMGHQFGGNHTQNNDCNSVSSTSMEPGSASTIMGYAGICAPDVQPHSDDYFHAVNLDEIADHVTGGGNTCATATITGNNPPSVTTSSTSFTLPKSTPFALTAIGVDPDGDMLTYCWEQMNPQTAPMPPVSTSTAGPMFRSLLPTTSPTRYFPNLPAVLSGTPQTWEVLPSVARTMNFRCTVRDNFPGAGCTDESNVTIQVNASAGPFVVTNPSATGITWSAGATATVTWNVANTNVPPVNTSQVDILLSVDGGLTYPYTLLSGTNNDGSQGVSVPLLASTMARVMVQAKNNIYYDVSNNNFTIVNSTPTFALTATPSTNSVCNTGSASYSLNIAVTGGFNSSLNFLASGAPPNSTLTFSPTTLTPPGNVTLTVGNLGNNTSGAFNINVSANGGSVTQTTLLSLLVFDSLSTPVTLSAPADGTTGLSPNPALSWQAISGVGEYVVQLSTNPSFAVLTETATVTATSFTPTSATTFSGVYYWRVRGVNPCNSSPWSLFRAFQLGVEECNTYGAVNLPLAIPNSGSQNLSTTIPVANNFTVSKVRVNLGIEHTWVGDLEVRLLAPDGTSATMFDRPGGSNCGNPNMDANFYDAAPNSAADLQATCNADPAIAGDFQPFMPFSIFIGKPSQGNWTANVIDHFNNDGGALTQYDLQLCRFFTPAAPTLSNNVLSVPDGQTEAITNAYLSSSGTGVQFILLSLPAHGTLWNGGTAQVIGSVFSQANINSGVFSYQHNGDNDTTDAFLFDVYVPSAGWLHHQNFHINILVNNLLATALLSQPILCNNGTNGAITVTASGGVAPLQYSLNGGAQQNSGVFANLGTGTYSVLVSDGNGFTANTNPIALVNPPALIVNVTVNGNDLTVNASGGTGTLTYSIDGTNFQAGNLFENLSNGSYTVTVQDANGCLLTATAMIALNTLFVNASLLQNIQCFGESNGVLAVTASGGSTPYQYSLNGGAYQSGNIFSGLSAVAHVVTVLDNAGFTANTNLITFSNPPALIISTSLLGNDLTMNASGGTGTLTYSIDGMNFQAGNLFENLPNGAYTVTVQDANDCSAMVSVIVAVNTMIVNAGVTQSISCFGENDGVITVSVGGGALPFQYSLNGMDFEGSPVFESLSAGAYTFTVLDNDGLTASSNTVNLSNPAQLSASASANGYTVNVTASGGTGALLYSLDGGTFQAGNTFFPVGNGLHSITVQDANGCTTSGNVSVFVSVLGVSGAITQNPSCQGGNNGTITTTATGGVSPYQYNLNGGTYQSNPVFYDLPAGGYFVGVLDAGGFLVNSTPVILTAPPALNASTVVNNYTLTVAASGGVAPYFYSLDGSAATFSNVFQNLSNGMHTIVVTDANGCTFSMTATVSVNLLNVAVSLQSPLLCHDDQNAVISVSAGGGIAPYQYSLNGGAFQSANIFSNLPSGSYVVTVKDAGGLMLAAPMVTVVNPPAIFLNATVFGPDISVTASGGTGALEYSFDGGAFQPENTATIAVNGTYNAVVRDENGCTATDEFTVNIPNNIVFGMTTVSCPGETDGQIIIESVSGGFPPYLYGLLGQPLDTVTVFSSLPAGEYIFVIQDASGYIWEVPAVLLSEPAPVVVISTSVQNNTVTVTAEGGVPPFQYSLGNGEPFQDSNVFEDVPPGTYFIVVKDVNDCSAITKVVVSAEAVGEAVGTLKFELLPNPNEGLFRLRFSAPLTGELRLTLHDVSGKLVYTEALFDTNGMTEKTVDARGLASGVYLLRLKGGERWGVVKVVVQ